MTVSGRSRIIDTGKMIIIDDCYNASPASMRSAIDTLRLADSRKVAVLGDMFELGPEERKMHYELGRYICDNGVDALITVGKLSEDIIRGLGEYDIDAPLPLVKDSGNSLVCNGIECYAFTVNGKFKEYAERILRSGDSVLLKASNSMHFTELVEFLKDK